MRQYPYNVAVNTFGCGDTYNLSNLPEDIIKKIKPVNFPKKERNKFHRQLV